MRLRPIVAADLPLADDPDVGFDDFGRRAPITQPPPCGVDADGKLGIEVDGEIVGTIGWHWVGYGPNAASRVPMLGIVIAAAHRGRGYGSQAQREATEMLFAATSVNRVEASTDVENLAEQRALEKIGFRREGVNRGAQWRRGEYHDLVMYAVLRDEWQDGRGAAPRAN